MNKINYIELQKKQLYWNIVIKTLKCDMHADL